MPLNQPMQSGTSAIQLRRDQAELSRRSRRDGKNWPRRWKVRIQRFETLTKSGQYFCTFDDCEAAPFQSQYLLNSHAYVHPRARPHHCLVIGCPSNERARLFGMASYTTIQVIRVHSILPRQRTKISSARQSTAVCQFFPYLLGQGQPCFRRDTEEEAIQARTRPSS